MTPKKSLESPGEMNLFAYTRNNPAGFVDPKGLESVGEIIERKALEAAHSGRTAATYGWAFAQTVWRAFGSEGISRIADKGTGASGGDMLGAAGDLAAVVPGGKIAGKIVGKAAVKAGSVLAKGTRKIVPRVSPNALGRAGEAAVRGAFNIGDKTKILINGRTRIPDGLTNRVLSEVKNVKSLSFTRQLRDFADFAGKNNLRFDLFVRPNTQMSGPLMEAVEQGVINLRFIP
jgi:hypothetical protein